MKIQHHIIYYLFIYKMWRIQWINEWAWMALQFNDIDTWNELIIQHYHNPLLFFLIVWLLRPMTITIELAFMIMSSLTTRSQPHNMHWHTNRDTNKKWLLSVSDWLGGRVKVCIPTRSYASKFIQCSYTFFSIHWNFLFSIASVMSVAIFFSCVHE